MLWVVGSSSDTPGQIPNLEQGRVIMVVHVNTGTYPESMLCVTHVATTNVWLLIHLCVKHIEVVHL